MFLAYVHHLQFVYANLLKEWFIQREESEITLFFLYFLNIFLLSNYFLKPSPNPLILNYIL